MGAQKQQIESETEAKLAELDRLLNDPATPLDPHRIWSLLAELSDPKPAAVTPHVAALRPSGAFRNIS